MAEASLKNQFEVKAVSENPTKTKIETSGSEFSVQCHETFGEREDGPNPEEYLLGSLIGGLNLASHVVAFEKDILIERINFEADGTIDRSKFRGEDMETKAGFTQINVYIDVVTDAESKDLEEWFEEVKARCSILDNLVNSTPVALKLDH